MATSTSTHLRPTGAPTRGRRLGRLGVAGLLALTSAASLAACADDPAPEAGGPGTTVSGASAEEAVATEGPEVTIAMFAFDPEVLEVPAGTTVTWRDTDKIDHTVSSDEGAPAIVELGLSGQGDTATHTFDEPGTYEYHCSIHTFMHGTVVVTE